jgi:hypothetical protein
MAISAEVIASNVKNFAFDLDSFAKKLEGEWEPVDKDKDVRKALDAIVDEWRWIEQDSDISPTPQIHKANQDKLLLVAVARHLKKVT